MVTLKAEVRSDPASCSPQSDQHGAGFEAPSFAPRIVQSLRTILLMLRVGSIRFTAFYFAAFGTALLATGAGTARWFAVAVALCAVNCLAIELANRWADRIEDRVNRPERTEFCEVVGYALIGRT